MFTTRWISLLFRNGSVLFLISSLGWSVYDTNQLHVKLQETWKMKFYCFVSSCLFFPLRVWECSFLLAALACRLHRCAATYTTYDWAFKWQTLKNAEILRTFDFATFRLKIIRWRTYYHTKRHLKLWLATTNVPTSSFCNEINCL